MKIMDAHEGSASLQIAAEDGHVLLAIHRDGVVTGEVEDASEAGARFVAYLRAHVFEQAHTPTDDEREALIVRLLDLRTDMRHNADEVATLDMAIEAIRRTVQGEPTDAQVQAGLDAYFQCDFYADYPNSVPHHEPSMRRALRAAAATQTGEQT